MFSTERPNSNQLQGWELSLIFSEDGKATLISDGARRALTLTARGP